MRDKTVIKTIQLSDDHEPITIETGWKAKKAGGSVWIRQGGTIVLVTATSSKEAQNYTDFFPLTINYIEKLYSAGRIPGGFLKRESRPSDNETLISRLIDRPLRPLFPKGFRNETQVIATVVSRDEVYSSDILALIGASAALTISNIPFDGPVGAVRVGKINDGFILNPSTGDFDDLKINLVMAGTVDNLVMVEAGMKNAREEEVIDAIEFGQKAINKIVNVQQEMGKEHGKEKMTFVDFSVPDEKYKETFSKVGPKLEEALTITDVSQKKNSIDSIKKQFIESINDFNGDMDNLTINQYKEAYALAEKNVFRRYTTDSGKRFDERSFTDIRDIDVEVDLLPNAHGSALFTRGETQALVAATLGTKLDSQQIDSIEGQSSKKFMLHYNFPPYCTGEVGFMRSPGRREIGHGALAERALKYIIPEGEDFPYTIRIVSEILESNGSSSMATVCGGCLSLMDGGIPVKDVVAGIAMGLIYEDDKFVVLSDILGMEDYLGDMDFKVAGTEDGITALQMDIKIKGINREILKVALKQAHDGKKYILNKMKEVLPAPREEMSPKAPRFEILTIKTDKIGLLIGPGGKNIKSIIEDTGVAVDISDDGKVNIFGKDKEMIEMAKERISESIQELSENEIYKAKVKKIVDYGAFVEVLPGVEGLLHVSQYSNERTENIGDHLSVGGIVEVKYMGKDNQGRIKLSRKAIL